MSEDKCTSCTFEGVIPTVEALQADPSTSYWLRKALAEAMQRDPVDAANDAALLSLALARRAECVLIDQPGTSQK
jgi:hypothetical protein